MRVVQIRKLNTQELFQRNNELIVQKIISRDFGSKVEKTRQYDEAFQRPINRLVDSSIINSFSFNNN
jgi:hypothetical protein